MANEVLTGYNRNLADRVIGGANYGGDMVENTVRGVAAKAELSISYKNVHATRGKAVRAEPVAARYEQRRIHHLGEMPLLDDELCMWIPGETTASPNRVDALVWALTELMVPPSGSQVWFLE